MHRLARTMSTVNQDQLTVMAILCLGTGVCLFTLREFPLNLECKKFIHLMVVVMLPAVAVFWTGETTMCAGTSSWYDFYSCLTAVQWLWHTALVLSGFFLYIRHSHRITVAMPSIDKRFITEPVKNFLELDPADDMILKVMSMIPILALVVLAGYVHDQMSQVYTWVQSICIVLAVLQLAFEVVSMIK
jgi:hypothetical protein